RRKSSSSVIISANSSTSAGGVASAATGIRPTRNGATHAMTRRSRWTSWPAPGRWTLTPTSSPGRGGAAGSAGSRPARQGWGGLRVEPREHRLQRLAEVGLDDLPHDGERLRRHLVPALAELVDELGREDALTRGEDLAELDVGGAELLGRQPEPLRQVRHR